MFRLQIILRSRPGYRNQLGQLLTYTYRCGPRQHVTIAGHATGVVPTHTRATVIKLQAFVHANKPRLTIVINPHLFSKPCRIAVLIVPIVMYAESYVNHVCVLHDFTFHCKLSLVSSSSLNRSVITFDPPLYNLYKSVLTVFCAVIGCNSSSRLKI